MHLLLSADAADASAALSEADCNCDSVDAARLRLPKPLLFLLYCSPFAPTQPLHPSPTSRKMPPGMYNDIVKSRSEK